MGMKELLIVLVVALVIFGAKKVRGIGEDLGHAVRGFKNSMSEGEQEEAAPAPRRQIRGAGAPDGVDAESPERAKSVRAEAAPKGVPGGG